MSEIVSTPFDAHQEVLSRVPDVELLAQSDRNIGSIKINYIDDGSVVPMGVRAGLEADFSNIDCLDTTIPEDFERFKEQVIKSLRLEKLRNCIAQLSPEERDLELKVFFAASLAVDYFGWEADGSFTQDKVEQSKAQRDRTYNGYALDESREDTILLKPLSVSGKSALCTEYAVFVKEALRLLGEDFCYIAAEKQYWTDEPSFYHSFLVSVDGKTIIDPLDAVQFPQINGIPNGVSNLTSSFFESSGPVVATRSWDEKHMTYSLTHVSVYGE